MNHRLNAVESNRGKLKNNLHQLKLVASNGNNNCNGSNQKWQTANCNGTKVFFAKYINRGMGMISARPHRSENGLRPMAPTTGKLMREIESPPHV